MTYRKTWFDCVVWILYAVLCIALLVYAGMIWAYYFAGVPYAENFPDSVVSPLAGMSAGMLSVIGVLVVPGTIGLYWMIRKIAGQIRKKCIWKPSVITGFECMAALLIMAAGIVLRIDYAKYDIFMAQNGLLFSHGKIQGMQYYDMAVVTMEHSAPSFSILGLGNLYVLCLSVVLSFLGNKFASAIVMQVFLQIIGMILAYVVTRKMAGRIPACAALLYLACSCCCMEMLVCVGPEWFFFDLYLFGMFFIVSYVRRYCENCFRIPAAVILAVFLGVVIGFLIWLHPTALTLLILLAAALIAGKKHRQEGRPPCHGAGVNAAVILTASLAAVLCFAGLTAVVSFENGIDFYGMTARCAGQFKLLQYMLPPIPSYPYYADIYLMGISVVFATFLVFDYLRKDKEQNYTLWMFLCVLTAPAPMFVLGQGGGEDFFGIFSLYVWAVLAGLGLQNCIFGGKAKAMQEQTKEQENQPVGGGTHTGQEQTKEVPMTDAQQEGTKTTETDAPEKPRFFENPLPLPKKHVKKEMDYQYQIDEKDMFYDIEVDDNDDFDI